MYESIHDVLLEGWRMYTEFGNGCYNVWIPYNCMFLEKYMNVTQTLQMGSNWIQYLNTKDTEVNCNHERIRVVGKNSPR